MGTKKPATKKGKTTPIRVEQVFVGVRKELEAGLRPDLKEAPLRDTADRIAFLWKASQLSQEELAAAFGVSHSGFKGWLAGRARPQLDNLIKIRDVAGVCIEWVAVGEGPIFLAHKSKALDRLTAGLVFVPRHVEGEIGRAFLAFREEWVRTRLRRNPSDLIAVEAYGDSMNPTIADGDVMLVDMSEDRVRGSAIYVLSVGKETIVKRIELRPDGSLSLRCDNPAYEPSTISSDGVSHFRVFGKVVWVGGSV